MFLTLSVTALPSTISFAVGNDRRSAYRFKITNLSWNEGEESVVLEAFQGERRLSRRAWNEGFPNVYRAKARRLRQSSDILIVATCDGRLTQYTGVWLFSPKDKRLKLLSKALSNADDSRLSLGILGEQGVDRWVFYPPRNDSPDGWFHRTWFYDRRFGRLIPGSWKPGMRRRRA